MGPFDFLKEATPQTANVAVAIAISVGTLYCVLGYRTLKIIIALTGFGLAATTAARLGHWLGEANPYATLGAGLVGGLSGAAALMFLYRMGVFCLGLAGALLAAVNVLSGRPEAWIVPAIIGIGLIGGLLALLIERPIMTLATSAIGSWLVVCGIAFFVLGADFVSTLGQTHPAGENERIVFLCWGVLALAGAIAQFATHNPKPKTIVREVPQ